MLFTLQQSRSSTVLSLFSLPSCPSTSGDAEHLLLPVDWWHSQLIPESLSRQLAGPLTSELLSATECVLGLLMHLLLVAEDCVTRITPSVLVMYFVCSCEINQRNLNSYLKHLLTCKLYTKTLSIYHKPFWIFSPLMYSFSF